MTQNIAKAPNSAPNAEIRRPSNYPAESFPSQAKHYVGEAADELFGAAKEAVITGRHLADKDAAKKVAGGATIGAVASLIAPVGLAAGAAIGAGIVAYRHLNKKNDQNKKS